MSSATSSLDAQLEQRLGYLDQDPQNLNLLADCADLSLQAGKLKDAEALIDHALSLSPDDPYFKTRKASIAMAQSRFDEAIELLNGVIAAGHDSRVIRYNLSYALVYAGRFAEAKEHLATVLESPEVPDAPILMMRTLHHLGELDEAITLGEKYVADHPGHGMVMSLLGMLYLDANDAEKSKYWTDQALENGEATPEALSTAGFLELRLEDTDKAAERFNQALEKNPKSGRGWAGLGSASLFALDLDGATDQFHKAVQFMPNHIGTWHALAWCQIMQNNLDGAEASFNAAMDLDRTFGETHGGLATVAVMRGKFQEAETLARRAAKLDPKSFSAIYARTMMAQAKGNKKIFGQTVQKVLRSQPAPGGGTVLDSLMRLVAKQQVGGKPNKN